MDHTKTLNPGRHLALLISSVLLAVSEPAMSEPTPEPLGVLNLSFEQTKQFVFDWSPVANATHYVLEENPDGESDFQVIADNIAADLTQYRHTVPLYRRTQARYRLLACLPDQTECPLVGETQVSVNNVAQLVNSIGYFKGFALKSGTLKDNEAPLEGFGNAIALSEDGTTLAVAAYLTDTVTPDGANYVRDAGTVFVYRQNTNSEWQQDQQLHAVVPHALDQFGHSLSLSADGKTLAVGVWNDSNDKTGITLDPSAAEMDYSTSEQSTETGAVYIFTRNDTDTTTPWHATAYIKDQALQKIEKFGQSVSLSADGTALAVGAHWGGTAIEDAKFAYQRNGAVTLYRLNDKATWHFVQTVQADNAHKSDQFGNTVSLDANGNWLAVGADHEANNTGVVYMFKSDGMDVDSWQFHHRLQASNAGERDGFGFALSLSADGQTLAVGAPWESSDATGIHQGDAQPTQPLNGEAWEYSGAVYLFTRIDTEGITTWQQQFYLKAPNRDGGDEFGTSVSLNRDGSQLIVGAWHESSSAIGLQGKNGNNSPSTGSAYYYRRSGTTWLDPVFLKSSNPGPTRGGFFGQPVVISGDGETVAVGSIIEAGATTGINDDQSLIWDRDSSPPGAVYLY